MEKHKMMMERENNIFFNVVTSENLMTELLCNILSFKVFRDAVLKLFLEEKDINFIGCDNFQTQYTLQNECGRPDLAISNDEYEILFEIKIDKWTGLTDNQPTSYLEYLNKIKKTNKWLIFLIPSDYVQQEEINNKIEQFKKNNPDSDVKTKIIHWNAIIGVIQNNELEKLSIFLNEFLELLKMWFEIRNINFSSLDVKAMYNEEIPKILRKLFDIVDGIKNYYSNRDYGLSSSKTSTEYSVYFKTAEGKTVFFAGLWFVGWEKYGKPIWYGIPLKSGSNEINRFKELHKDCFREEESYLMSWIDDEVIKKNNCLEEIIKLLDDELKQLRSD